MRQSRKYTLVEMLVVIAVAAVIVSLGVPAVSKMLKGNAVDNAASAVRNMLDEARSKAVASRRYTALVLDLNTEGGGEYQSMRICKVSKDDDDDDDYIFDGWIPGSKWEEVSPGAVIDRVETVSQIKPFVMRKLQEKTDWNAPDEISGVETDRGKMTLAGIIFGKNGGLLDADKAVYIRLAEGLQKNQFEMTYTDGSIGDVPDNCLVLMVNQFTGLVRYVSEDN